MEEGRRGARRPRLQEKARSAGLGAFPGFLGSSFRSSFRVHSRDSRASGGSHRGDAEDAEKSGRARERRKTCSAVFAIRSRDPSFVSLSFLNPHQPSSLVSPISVPSVSLYTNGGQLPGREEPQAAEASGCTYQTQSSLIGSKGDGGTPLIARCFAGRPGLHLEAGGSMSPRAFAASVAACRSVVHLFIFSASSASSASSAFGCGLLLWAHRRLRIVCLGAVVE